MQYEVPLAFLLARGDIIHELQPLKPRVYEHSEDEEHFGSIHLIAVERPGQVENDARKANRKE